MKTYSNFAGKEDIPYLPPPENWHKNWRKGLIYRYCRRQQYRPYRIWLESPPYSKTAMILLDQKKQLEGGGVDVKIDFIFVY